MDIIDTQKLLSLRPASVRPRLGPRDETLLLSPSTLLPVLRAPLLEIPLAWGGWVEACLRAANVVDAPLCLCLDAQEAAARSMPAGLHQGVGAALEHVRGAAFRRPLILHARLGLFDAQDEATVDAARLRVLEAVDAGVTSVQLGGVGDPAAVGQLLREILQPASDNGAGTVVELLDSEQVVVVPALVQAALGVDAWVAPTLSTLHPRREPLTLPVLAPFARWVDGTVPLGAVMRDFMRPHQDLQTSAALLALWGASGDVRRDRLETRLHSETQELLTLLGARGSAGNAMVALSQGQGTTPPTQAGMI